MANTINMELSINELRLINIGLESLKRMVSGADLNQLRQRVESSLKQAECNCGGSGIDPEHIEAQPCKCSQGAQWDDLSYDEKEDLRVKRPALWKKLYREKFGTGGK